MTALLSDHLKATRDGLKRRGLCLFMMPLATASFIRRINTLVALAVDCH